MTARISVLLHGFAFSSPDEGSIGFCGVYLVEAPGPRRLIVDTGHAGRRRALGRALAERGLAPADIDGVLVTHAHWDHVQNVDLFPESTVYAHPDEMSGPRTRPAGHGDELADGVTVVGLPGHTAGSIGLSVVTDRGVALLTGDAVSSAHSLRTGRCTITHHDPAVATRSLRLVAETADLVYPGHDHPFRVAYGRPADYLIPARPIVLRGPDPAKPVLPLYSYDKGVPR